MYINQEMLQAERDYLTSILLGRLQIVTRCYHVFTACWYKVSKNHT